MRKKIVCFVASICNAFVKCARKRNVNQAHSPEKYVRETGNRSLYSQSLPYYGLFGIRKFITPPKCTTSNRKVEGKDIDDRVFQPRELVS